MLIGLIGKARAGKDSLAATLVAERSFIRFAFADALKRAALQADPYVLAGGYFVRLSELVEEVGWEVAKEHEDVRRFLQNFGQGAREIDPDFWVRRPLDGAVSHVRLGGNAVITDVRYPNEADAIRRAGGVLVRVLRHSADTGDRHLSETALDAYPVDRTVYNAGTLGDLQRVARTLPLP